jgi:predicted dehydrogenase
MAPIQVALVGVGLSGQVFHAPPILALPELFNLKTVVERSPKSPRGTIGDKFNVDIKIVHSFQEALEDPAIELVVVGTPSSTHFEMAKVREATSNEESYVSPSPGSSASQQAR